MRRKITIHYHPLVRSITFGPFIPWFPALSPFQRIPTTSASLVQPTIPAWHLWFSGDGLFSPVPLLLSEDITDRSLMKHTGIAPFAAIITASEQAWLSCHLASKCPPMAEYSCVPLAVEYITAPLFPMCCFRRLVMGTVGSPGGREGKDQVEQWWLLDFTFLIGKHVHALWWCQTNVSMVILTFVARASFKVNL